MIKTLPRAAPEPPGKPVREGASAGQERARRLALRPQTWDRREAVAMADVFDAAASTWNESRGDYRRPVLAWAVLVPVYEA